MKEKFDIESARKMNVLELLINVYNEGNMSGIILVTKDETFASKVDSYTHEKTALDICKAVIKPDFEFKKSGKFMTELTEQGIIVALLITGANPMIYIPSVVTDYQKDVLMNLNENSNLMNKLSEMRKIRFSKAFNYDKKGLFEPYVYMDGKNNLTLNDALNSLNNKKVK